MLAYVFWHWKKPAIAETEYRECLARFHRDLAANAPGGYRGSRVFAVTSVPGISVASEFLEDWYFIDDFAALGTLNDAAVSARNRAVHDAAASLAEGGVAGIYKRCSERGSEPAPSEPTFVAWFAKPPGTTYPELFARVPSGVELWQRQMVLGPAPEFCALAANSDPLGALSTLNTAAATIRPVRTVLQERL